MNLTMATALRTKMQSVHGSRNSIIPLPLTKLRHLNCTQTFVKRTLIQLSCSSTMYVFPQPQPRVLSFCGSSHLGKTHALALPAQSWATLSSYYSVSSLSFLREVSVCQVMRPPLHY